MEFKVLLAAKFFACLIMRQLDDYASDTKNLNIVFYCILQSLSLNHDQIKCEMASDFTKHDVQIILEISKLASLYLLAYAARLWWRQCQK